MMPSQHQQCPLRVAVPNRHITGVILEVLSKAGWSWDALLERQYSFLTHDRQLRVFIVKAHDIPHMIVKKIFDAGLIQASVVAEEGCPLAVVKNFPLAQGKMVLAVPEEGPVTSAAGLQGKRLVTRNPHLARQFLKENHLDCPILVVKGSPEAYAFTGSADAVLAYRKTGRTLQENGLRLLADVCPSHLQLVSSEDNAVNSEILSMAKRIDDYLENQPIPERWRLA